MRGAASSRSTMIKNSLRADIDHFLYEGEQIAFFEDIHVEFDGGEICIVLGASGRGKTTFIRLLLGNANGAASGKIEYRMRDRSFSTEEIQLAGKVGIVTQDPALIPWLPTKENLELPMQLNPSLSRPRTSEVEQAILELGLDTTILKRLPHDLSFGTRQRVAFARCMLYEPSFLMLDETFTGLDPVNVDRMERVLKGYVIKTGAVCVLITHNVLLASKFADRIYYLSRERKLERLQSCKISEIQAKFASDY
jgi:ABC-type nitrate/sulfonate/bicarbonate transport system ATPase subunit